MPLGGKNPTTILTKQPSVPAMQVSHIPSLPPGILKPVSGFENLYLIIIAAANINTYIIRYNCVLKSVNNQ